MMNVYGARNCNVKRKTTAIVRWQKGEMMIKALLVGVAYISFRLLIERKRTMIPTSQKEVIFVALQKGGKHERIHVKTMSVLWR